MIWTLKDQALGLEALLQSAPTSRSSNLEIPLLSFLAIGEQGIDRLALSLPFFASIYLHSPISTT